MGGQWCWGGGGDGGTSQDPQAFHCRLQPLEKLGSGTFPRVAEPVLNQSCVLSAEGETSGGWAVSRGSLSHYLLPLPKPLSRLRAHLPPLLGWGGGDGGLCLGPGQEAIQEVEAEHSPVDFLLGPLPFKTGWPPCLMETWAVYTAGPAVQPQGSRITLCSFLLSEKKGQKVPYRTIQSKPP